MNLRFGQGEDYTPALRKVDAQKMKLMLSSHIDDINITQKRKARDMLHSQARTQGDRRTKTRTKVSFWDPSSSSTDSKLCGLFSSTSLEGRYVNLV